MQKTLAVRLGALSFAALLAAGAAVEAGDAARTRSGGSARQGVASGSASRDGAPARIASGRATWRHGGRGGRHHHRHTYLYLGHYGWYPLYYGYGYGYGGSYHGWGYPRVGYYGGARDRYPAVIVTDVRPKRAVVRLDGEEVGQARDYNGNWDRLEVEPGLRELTFEAPGYRTLTVHVDAEPGQRYVIYQRLRRGEGSDPRSTRAPGDGGDRAGPQAAPRTSIEPGERERQALRKGLLRLRVSPGDAAVYLDGEFLARADELARLHGALPVARGTHVIEVVRPGYVSHAVDVEVKGETPVEVAIELRRR